jgi:preflagellin peptidase FlaK
MFALTIFTNTVLVAIFWPLYTAVQNARNGDFNIRHPGLMFTARKVNLADSLTHHGKIIPLWTFENTTALSRFKTLLLSVVYGFEIEFVRNYIDWHRETIDPDITSPADIDFSRVEHFLDSEANTNENGERIWDASNTDEATEAFEELLGQETVWMTPGIPFIVPMLLGLVISLTAGDIIYWLVVLFG